jgi:hypothetical protein
MTAFYQSLISFLQQELPAVAEAIKQAESLPEQTRLHQIERMMRELLDCAISQDGKG